MAKKYIVDLNKDEKAELVALTQKGRPGARKIMRANIMLLVGSGKPDFEVAELLHTSCLSLSHRWRARHKVEQLSIYPQTIKRLKKTRYCF